MNLFETLKQFKNIEPNANYSATSKRAILAQGSVTPSWSPRHIILRILETGVAVALTGFFILLVTGGLQSSDFAPIQYSAIDPQSLHAEAEAIDMQIQLANLNYTEPSTEAVVVPLSAAATIKNGAATTAPLASSTASSASTTAPEVTSANGGVATTSSMTSTVSIDEALQGLSN